MQLHQEAWGNAFLLMFVAGVSDGLDGFLARAFNWRSRLGAILDPLADKALLVFVFLMLAHKGVIPLWLALLVVFRDVIILLGATTYRWLFKELTIAPLLISKVNTAAQILFVLAIMYHLAIESLPTFIVNGLQILVAATTMISGIAYVIIWSRNARVAYRSKKQDE